MAHRFTIGVEEEFQIVDPNTWELRSHVSELMASGAPTLGEHIKREMHQSIVEVGTKVCRTPAEVRAELVNLRDRKSTRLNSSHTATSRMPSSA